MYIRPYIFPQGFEWDPAKRERNIAKHGIDFFAATAAFDSRLLVAVDHRRDYGEVRYRGIGDVHGVAVVLVWTERGETIRLISVWKANAKETKAYRAGS